MAAEPERKRVPVHRFKIKLACSPGDICQLLAEAPGPETGGRNTPALHPAPAVHIACSPLRRPSRPGGWGCQFKSFSGAHRGVWRRQPLPGVARGTREGPFRDPPSSAPPPSGRDVRPPRPRSRVAPRAGRLSTAFAFTHAPLVPLTDLSLQRVPRPRLR